MPIPAGLANRASYQKSYQCEDHRVWGTVMQGIWGWWLAGPRTLGMRPEHLPSLAEALEIVMGYWLVSVKLSKLTLEERQFFKEQR